MSTDDSNASVNASQELFAQAGTPTLMPRVGLENIPLDLWRDIDCELDAEFLPRRAPSRDC
jgi:hypothetical protein